MSRFRPAVKAQLKAKVALCGPTGSGKALAVDEVVQTPMGERPIGELAVGDKVICPDGSVANVTGVYPQGVQPIYRVLFSGGAEVRATAEHLWVTQTRRERYARTKLGGTRIKAPRPGVVRTTAEIAASLRADHGVNHTLREVFPWDPPETDLPMDPWVMGFLLGDGCFASKGCSLSTADPEIVERVARHYRLRPFGGQVNWTVSGARPTLNALGLVRGTKSVGKFIPDVFLSAGAKQRLELLRGLMDSDGSCNPTKPGAEFSTISPHLARQVRWLVESLGGTARTTARAGGKYAHKGEVRTGQPSFRIHVAMPTGMCPFWLARKADTWAQSNAKRQRQAIRRFVVGVVPDGEAEAVCISIDHPEREFCTAHFVPTHNTWTALEWATVLADGGRVAVIDTENDSASYYADRFAFDVLPWDPPYDPRTLAEAIREAAAEGYAVVVIDSLSHYWEGEGGTLDIVDNAAQRSHGNSFAGWKVGTPALRFLVDTVRHVPMHVIATMRSSMEYVLETDNKGKQSPRKVGMAPVMRKGVEYEFAVVGDLDLEHRLVISKSRCADLADQVAQPGRAHELAEVFAKWLASGEAPVTQAQADELAEIVSGIGDAAARVAAKQEFVAEFGKPDRLPAGRFDEAKKWAEAKAAAAGSAQWDETPFDAPDGDGALFDEGDG